MFNESRSYYLLLFNTACAWFAVGQIWLVQMSCYPLWRYVGPGHFQSYHVYWWHSIWLVILVPAAFTFIGSLAIIRYRPSSVSPKLAWAAVAVQLNTWVLTGIFWARWQAELTSLNCSANIALFHLLLTTHWLRVTLITAYALIVTRMLIIATASVTHYTRSETTA